jgi:hypothetical protein
MPSPTNKMIPGGDTISSVGSGGIIGSGVSVGAGSGGVGLTRTASIVGGGSVELRTISGVEMFRGSAGGGGISWLAQPTNKNRDTRNTYRFIVVISG